jgi:polyphosphate kinase
VYLASADLMQRNLYRRVEVAFPVEEPALKERVILEGLQVYLDDTEGAWEMSPNGEYARASSPARPVRLGADDAPREPLPEPIEAQRWLITQRVEP